MNDAAGADVTGEVDLMHTHFRLVLRALEVDSRESEDLGCSKEERALLGGSAIFLCTSGDVVYLWLVLIALVYSRGVSTGVCYAPCG